MLKKMHPLNRPGQRETYDQIMQSDEKWNIAEGPTGIGKSAWPAQCGHDGNRTMSVVRTKSLQHQYKDSYKFKVIKGKNAHPCGSDPSTPCDICHVTLPANCDCIEACECATKSWCAGNCNYYLSRYQALRSNLVTLNYSKFVLELNPKFKGFIPEYEPGILWLDEAHELSDVVCDFSGFQLQWDKVRDYFQEDTVVMNHPLPIKVNQCKNLLTRLLASLPNIKVGKNSSRNEIKEFRKVDNFKRKINNTLRIIGSGLDWYAHSDEKEIILKPLTAKYHFQHLFDQAEKVVMMSATIGKPQIFTKELGIEKYYSIKVPHYYPAVMRPIVDMQCPKMGYNSTEQDRQRQAEIIAKSINQFSPNWSGIILVNSKVQARNMQERLYKLTDRPIWLQPEYLGTDEMLQSWMNFYQSQRGAIGCTWAMWEGCDLGDNEFVIVAKTPFPTLKKGTYDHERYMYDVAGGQQRIANKLVQGLGRVRRGKIEHLGRNKFVGIADGNWTRVKKYVDPEILKSIVKTQ